VGLNIPQKVCHEVGAKYHPGIEQKLILILVFLFPVQHECIPQAVLGMDILCQAKSGMGKTAVFVLATLQQLEPTDNQVYVLVMCHTRELAFQISKEYERFSKYMPQVKVSYSPAAAPLLFFCHTQQD